MLTWSEISNGRLAAGKISGKFSGNFPGKITGKNSGTFSWKLSGTCSGSCSGNCIREMFREVFQENFRDSFQGIFFRFSYSKTLNNRTGWANNEYRGGPGGPGTGFCSPGDGFLVLVAVVACYYVYYHYNRPRDYKNQYQDHQDQPATRH